MSDSVFVPSSRSRRWARVPNHGLLRALFASGAPANLAGAASAPSGPSGPSAPSAPSAPSGRQADPRDDDPLRVAPAVTADATREGARGAFAERVMETAGTLRRLARQTEPEWREAGLDEASCATLSAALELARRLCDEPLVIGAHFASPRQIYEHFRLRLRDEKREMFFVVLLDARHRVLCEEVISIGSLTSSIVHPREVFLPAIRESASAVVLIHNHPSGDARPSEEDIAVTGRLRRAAELIGITILDHLVIGDTEFTSLREQGVL